MKTLNYLDFRAELVAKYGEEEVKKAETDNFLYGGDSI